MSYQGRPHDPSLCDYLVVEGTGGGEASSTRFVLVDVPDAADAFDETETGKLQMMTFVGQGIPRAPAKR